MDDKKTVWLYTLFFLSILIGLLIGIFKNSFASLFFDFNAWIYFLLIPAYLDVFKNSKNVKIYIDLLLVSILWLSIKTIITLYLFSHGIFTLGDYFYKWIRDSGVGEITYMSRTLFRIFFQSHIYALIALLLIATLIFADRKFNLKYSIFLGINFYLASLAIIISQSRSFWVGGIMAFLLLTAFSLFKFKIKISRLALALLSIFLIFYSQFSTVNLISGNYKSGVLVERFKNIKQDEASISRLNQLAPLKNQIIKSPIFGSGFGAEITYISNDPRIKKTHPQGVYTTTAFELGYLDIWLKIGAVGLLLYLSIIIYAASKILTMKKFNNETYLGAGLIFRLIGLAAVNIFSPYLNHPLGISFVMLASSLVNIEE